MCSFRQLKHSEVLGECPRPELVEIEWTRITRDTLQIKGRVELPKKKKKEKTGTFKVFIPYVAGRGLPGFSILLTANSCY